jgi:hypothetical protein
MLRKSKYGAVFQKFSFRSVSLTGKLTFSLGNPESLQEESSRWTSA